MIVISQKITGFNTINLPVTAASYDPAHTYSYGDECLYEHRVYKSAIDANTGNTPTEQTSESWVLLRVENAYAMLDNRASTKTVWSPSTSSGTTDYLEFSFYQGEVTHLAFVGLVSSSLSIDLLDGDGNVMHTSSRGNKIWCGDTTEYNYMFAPYCEDDSRGTSAAMYFVLPQVAGGTIRIRAKAGANGTAEIGDIIGGESFNLGCAQWGIPRSIDSTGSFKRTDFGDFDGRRRTPARRMTVNIKFDSSTANTIYDYAVSTLHDAVALYVADPRDDSMFDGLVILAKGTYAQTLDNPTRSSASITLEEAI